MVEESRRDRCSRLLEEWREPRLSSIALDDDQVRLFTRELIELCLKEGCRAELLQASAAYRTMEGFVRALLEARPDGGVLLRLAEPRDDAVVARHYLEVWRSYGTPEDHFAADALERTLQFIATARNAFEGGCVLAESGGTVRGSVGFQIQAPQFPEVLRPELRKVGYIWSVYVDPESRGQGIAKLMTQKALDILRSTGCTMVILHASEAGAPVYSQLGFKPGPEMRLKF